MSLQQTVYAWSDSSWRHAEEYCEVEDAWKGNDYIVLTYPGTATEDEIDESIDKYFRGVK